jgi:hypothetical protein
VWGPAVSGRGGRAGGAAPTAGLWRVLGRVYDGERAFAPAGDGEAARRAFERDVDALIELEARGLVEGLRVLPADARANCRYRGAAVAGVSERGAGALEGRRRRGEC